MEFNNGFDINESQLDQDIRRILNSPESSQGDSDIQRFVSFLWEKVGNCNSDPGTEKVSTRTTTNNPTNANNVSSPQSSISVDCSTTSTNSTIDGNSNSNNVVGLPITELNQSIFLQSNNATPQPTSPSILPQPAATVNREKRTINSITFCCKNEAMGKQLTNLSYMEFINQKSEFCRILKQICVKTPSDQMYFYIFDSSIHVKTNSLILQIQNIKKIQYVICEGYKHSLIFCDQLLSIENFLYFTLLSRVQLVSLHTVANLCMNHLATNRLPLYMSLDIVNKSKFVRTFLKLTKFEFYYNSIKHRIPSIIKHNHDCTLLK